MWPVGDAPLVLGYDIAGSVVPHLDDIESQASASRDLADGTLVTPINFASALCVLG